MNINGKNNNFGGTKAKTFKTKFYVVQKYTTT